MCCQVINDLVKVNNSGVTKTVSGMTETDSEPEAFQGFASLDSRSHDIAGHMTRIKTDTLKTAVRKSQDKTVS